MRPIIYIAIGIIGVCLLGLLFMVFPKKPQDISSPPAIVEFEATFNPTLSIPDINTGIGEDEYKHLTIIVEGEEIIQFQPDKKIIGMDGRIIGYLNDEEVELLQKFWE